MGGIHLKKTTIYVMIITFVSKLMGFFREITLSYYFGASSISDVYLISTSIPTVLFSFIAVAISAGYIPVYTKIENVRGESECNNFTNNLANLIIIVCTIIFIFGFIYTTEVVKIFASGFSNDSLDLAVFFTKITLGSIIFRSLFYLYSSYLQIKGNFYISLLSGIPFNLIIILSIILTIKTNIILLPLGTVGAIFIQFLMVLIFSYKFGYRYKFTLNLNDDYIKKMMAITIPIMIGISINQINVIIDRTIASQIVVGGITALNYAYRLIEFIEGIFVVSIMTVMYPIISKLATNNLFSEIKAKLISVVTMINIVIIPIMTLTFLFSEEIIMFLYGRGAFDELALKLTSNALIYYSVGLLGFGITQVLSRVFYALDDINTPMKCNAIGLCINIILNIILSKIIGIGGIALATSISAILTTILLFITLRRKIGPLGLVNLIANFSKVTIVSILIGLIVKQIHIVLLLFCNRTYSLMISIIVSFIFYISIIMINKIFKINKMLSKMNNELLFRSNKTRGY